MTRRFLTEKNEGRWPPDRKTYLLGATLLKGQVQPTTLTIFVTYLAELLLWVADVMIRVTVVLALSARFAAFSGVTSCSDESISSYSAKLSLPVGVTDFLDELLRRILNIIIAVAPLAFAIHCFALLRFRSQYTEFMDAFRMRLSWGTRDVLAGALIIAIPAAVGMVVEALAGALIGVKETSTLQATLPISGGMIGVAIVHKYYARKEKEVHRNRLWQSLLRNRDISIDDHFPPVPLGWMISDLPGSTTSLRCVGSFLLVGSLRDWFMVPLRSKTALQPVAFNETTLEHKNCRGCIVKQLGAMLDPEDELQRMTLEVVSPSKTRRGWPGAGTTFKIDTGSRNPSREIYMTVPRPLRKAIYRRDIDSHQHVAPNVRSLNILHIDYDFLRSCLAHCRAGHQRCETPLWSNYTTGSRIGTPILLMDLVDRCLVWETMDADYACLSYVWGQHSQSFECRGDNLPRLLEVGSFNDPSLFSVPATIRDAMRFTVNMGLRYMWIDRYCIVQDDHREKAARIASMGSIYSGASFTIIAADGDARDGLPGVSVPDQLGALRRLLGSQAVIPFRAPNCLGLSRDEQEMLGCQALFGVKHSQTMVGNSWATRGWTFQEQLFSRRTVVFHRGIVIWRCQEHVWQEDFDGPIALEDVFAPTSSATRQGERLDNMDGWPNLGRYAALLSKYSARQFTYPCDSHSAFAAVLDFLSQYSFPGGFLFGLPEVLFDVALLWYPASGGGAPPLQDRVAMAEEASLDAAELPTWSWTRWSGGFDFSMWSAATDCLRLSSYDQNICEITPIVQWQKVCETGARHPIRNDFAKFRRQPLDPQAVADGFCHEVETPSHQGYQSFRYPVPRTFAAPPLTNDMHIESPAWRPLIYGRVSRAFVTVGDVETQTQGSLRWRSLKSGLITIGVILLQDSSLPDNEIEVIRLSEGYCPPRPLCKLEQTVGFSHTALSRWELRKGAYSFYNVMWISWTDGVARREAVGRIEKSSWDDLAADEIDVVLG